MKKCYASLIRFLSDEQGNTSVEYAAMLSMILLTVNVSVETLGTSISGKYDDANGAFVGSSNQSSGSSSSSSGSSNNGPLQGNSNARGTGTGKGQGSGNGLGNGS